MGVSRQNNKATDPEGFMMCGAKANLTRIVLNAPEKVNDWRNIHLWDCMVLGSLTVCCMEQRQRAKGKKAERGKLSTESWINRWETMRSSYRWLYGSVSSKINLFQVFRYVGQTQWSHTTSTRTVKEWWRDLQRERQKYGCFTQGVYNLYGDGYHT